MGKQNRETVRIKSKNIGDILNA